MSSMSHWRWWASVPFIVIAISSVVRGMGIADGDFNVSGVTTPANDHWWGAAWIVWGLCCFASGLMPARRRLRLVTAGYGILLLYSWALARWLSDGRDFGDPVMWGFIAFGTLIAWCWGNYSAPLEREHRKEQ